MATNDVGYTEKRGLIRKINDVVSRRLWANKHPLGWMDDLSDVERMQRLLPDDIWDAIATLSGNSPNMLSHNKHAIESGSTPFQFYTSIPFVMQRGERKLRLRLHSQENMLSFPKFKGDILPILNPALVEYDMLWEWAEEFYEQMHYVRKVCKRVNFAINDCSTYGHVARILPSAVALLSPEIRYDVEHMKRAAPIPTPLRDEEWADVLGTIDREIAKGLLLDDLKPVFTVDNVDQS